MRHQTVSKGFAIEQEPRSFWMRRQNAKFSNRTLYAWLLCAVFLLPSSTEAYWGTKGSASASTYADLDESSVAFGERIYHNETVSSVSAWTDFEGDASANYGASFPGGAVWARTWAQHTGIYASTDARAQTSLHDTIIVEVPAGTYPEGVAVVVTGAFEGDVRMWGDRATIAQANWEAILEFEDFFDSVDFTASSDFEVDASVDHAIDDPFVLTTVLYPPGAVVISPHTFEIYLNMAIGWPENHPGNFLRSWTYEGSLTPLVPLGWSSIDIVGQITDIDVTGGVTWSTESGALLLPEPGLSLSVLIGGMFLSACVRKRRFQ